MIAKNTQIRELVDAFVADLEQRIHDSIRAGFEAALGDAPRSPARKAGPARTPAAPAAKATGKGARPGRRAARKKGQKRSPAELAKVQADLLAYIKANAGQRVEEINKALGLTTPDVSGPLLKLIASKAVVRKGQKRASRYYPR